MRLKKYFSIISAISILATTVPFTVSANKKAAVPEYRVVDGEKAIITNVITDETRYEIPVTIVDGDKTYEVIGVDDFAFGLCENLDTIIVPDALSLENTGNVAFLTKNDFKLFMDNELAETADFEDIVVYIANKANYKNGAELTDDDIAEAAVKLNQKLNMVDISVETTTEGKIITLLRNVKQMNFSDELQASFDLWLATITYDELTLAGSADVPMQAYATGREILGMNYEVIGSSFLPGDANGDGKFNVRDAAYVASNVAKSVVIDPIKVPAADFNGDGVVNVRDAAAMARALSSGTAKK